MSAENQRKIEKVEINNQEDSQLCFKVEDEVTDRFYHVCQQLSLDRVTINLGWKLYNETEKKYTMEVNSFY